MFALDFEFSSNHSCSVVLISQKVAFRLWDIFFVEGLDFVVQFIISMFRIQQKEIMNMVNAEMLVHLKVVVLSSCDILKTVGASEAIFWLMDRCHSVVFKRPSHKTKKSVGFRG